MSRSSQLPALLLAALLAGGLQAAPQSSSVVQVGDPPFALPVSLTAAGVSGHADHAVVAMNSRGDVCVAWHTQRLDLAGEPAQVEAAVLPYLGNGRWEAPLDASSGLLFVLGDPAVHVLQTQVHEACRKADVVAMGEDFVVTWPRTPLGGNTAGSIDTRLEVARIFRDPASGAWLVDEPSPGVGWLLDGTVSNGAGGVMPDLAADDGLWPGLTAVAYVHAVREALPERDFELRLTVTDFSGSPPLVLGTWTLDRAVPLDDPLGLGGPSGGKVLPDVVFDDEGRLILAYEAYGLANHVLPGLGALPADQGRIVVERWDLASGTPVLLERWYRYGSDPAWWQRRPNLATSRQDRKNAVSLSWMVQDTGGTDTDTSYEELTLPATGPASWSDLGFPNLAWVDHRMPVPVHGANQLRICLSSEGSAQPRAGVAWLPMQQVLLPLPPAPMDKWRFAADLWEPGNGQVLAVTWESPTGPAGVFRVQIILRQP